MDHIKLLANTKVDYCLFAQVWQFKREETQSNIHTKTALTTNTNTTEIYACDKNCNVQGTKTCFRGMRIQAQVTGQQYIRLTMQRMSKRVLAIHRVETLLVRSLCTTAEHFCASVTVNVNASSSGHNGRSRSSASVISALNELRSTQQQPHVDCTCQQHARSSFQQTRRNKIKMI